MAGLDHIHSCSSRKHFVLAPKSFLTKLVPITDPDLSLSGMPIQGLAVYQAAIAAGGDEWNSIMGFFHL